MKHLKTIDYELNMSRMHLHINQEELSVIECCFALTDFRGDKKEIKKQMPDAQKNKEKLAHCQLFVYLFDFLFCVNIFSLGDMQNAKPSWLEF